MRGRLEFLVWGGEGYGRLLRARRGARQEQGTPMPVDLESFKGKIDFGIISIREDEFLAVLERFAPDRYAMGSQRYEIGTVGTNGGGHYTVAAVRCVEQGRGHAQKVATDLIRDLEPRWLLVVGIGGAVPSMDFTLGDVVCATRVHDFSVRAVKEGATDTYSAGGGPMHPEIQRLLASLPAIVRQDLGDWNSPEALGTPKPTLRVPGANSDRYYGDVKWKAELRRTLLHHFPEGHAPRPPLATSGSVATSDALVKSTGLLNQWQEYARGVAAVEMELGGVFLAARQIDREYPILAIRGISDIVGFKREEQWTKYACTTAAAFAYALIRAGAAFEPRIAEMSRGSQALLEQAAPDGSPVGEVHLVYLPRETSFGDGPWPNKNIWLAECQWAISGGAEDFCILRAFLRTRKRGKEIEGDVNPCLAQKQDKRVSASFPLPKSAVNARITVTLVDNTGKRREYRVAFDTRLLE